MRGKAPKLFFTISRIGVATRITFSFEQKAGCIRKVMVFSDPHLDSKKSNRDYFIQFMDQAVREGAVVIITGDLADLMAGPDDRRGARDTLRDPYTREQIWDDIVSDLAKLLHPYRFHIAMISEGNHEANVRRRYGTDIVQRIIAILNDRGGNIQFGRYSGWIEFRFQATGKCQDYHTINLNYHHGSGLSSKSKLFSRAGEYPDADILTFGHFHNHWSERLARQRKVTGGQTYQDHQLLLGVPGMKDDCLDSKKTSGLNTWGDASEGWSVENGHRTKPLGAWWLDFEWSRINRRVLFTERAARLD